MKTYLVIVRWDKPYPKEERYTMKGSSFAIAINKTLRAWRRNNPRQVIRRVIADATLLQVEKRAE